MRVLCSKRILNLSERYARVLCTESEWIKCVRGDKTTID